MVTKEVNYNALCKQYTHVYHIYFIQFCMSVSNIYIYIYIKMFDPLSSLSVFRIILVIVSADHNYNWLPTFLYI